MPPTDQARIPGKTPRVMRQTLRFRPRATLVVVGAQSYDRGMSKRGRDLLERALELPMSERARLAQELLDSLDDKHAGKLEVDPEYRPELERRASEEPAHGERWPTAAEVVARIRGDLDEPARKPKKRERGA